MINCDPGLADATQDDLDELHNLLAEAQQLAEAIGFALDLSEPLAQIAAETARRMREEIL